MRTQSLLDQFIMKLDATVLPGNTNYAGEIYHYTSLKSINSILLEHGDNINLWASRYDCLNDISEGKVVVERYREACEELREQNLISDEIYEIFVHASPSKNETFIIWDGAIPRPVRCEFGTYITSFSEEYDLLPMWNYYSKGNAYEGVNIGLSSENIVETMKQNYPNGNVRVSACQVIYKKEEQKELIKKLLLELYKKFENGYETSVRALISMNLTEWQMIFKNECFEHEKEVRIIVKICNKYKDKIKVHYRSNLGYIIPYIELKINKEAVKSMTLGPVHGNDEQKTVQAKVLHDMLTTHNYNVLERCSKIPVRY